MTTLAGTPAEPRTRAKHEAAVGISCTEFRTFDELTLRRQEWDRFVEAVGGDIYFSYDWCRLWWNYYGGGRQLRILVFRRGVDIVGLLPLVLERLWLGPVPVRVAKFAGADSTIVVLNPAVRPEYAHVTYRDALRYLLEECRCDVVYLGPLSGERPHCANIVTACDELHDEAQVMHAGAFGVHTVIALPNTMEEYLAGLSKSERGNYRRDVRNLTKDYAVRFEVVPPEQAEQGFEEFVRLHTAQWRHEGKLGHFGDWPRSVEFNRELVQALAPRGQVRLARLLADEIAAQIEFSLSFGQSEYWRLPARRIGSWERYGVGRVARVERFAAAIAKGVRRVEAGPGHYEYKLKLGGREFPLESVLISANRSLAIAKARTLCSAAALLNLLYYRIWFCRLAPRFPLFRRPLWKTWIRWCR